MKFKLFVFFVIAAIVFACNKDKFQTRPTISVKSITPDLVPLNGNLVVTLECTDKEGDVQGSVIVIKNRLNKRVVPTIRDTIRYPIPSSPKNSRTEIITSLDYQSVLSAINPPSIPGSNPARKENDTLILKMAVIDNAGHSSDTIPTKQIIVYRQ